MSDQIHVFGQEVESACRIRALALSWWSSKPWVPWCGRHWHHSSKTLGRQCLIYIPIGVDHLPVLERYGGYMARFREARHHLFCNTLRSLEFRRWGLTWEDPRSRLLLCFGIVLKDPHFFARYNVPDVTRSSSVKLLQHNYVSTIQPYRSSAPQSSCEGPNGCNVLRHLHDHGEFGSHFPVIALTGIYR